MLNTPAGQSEGLRFSLFKSRAWLRRSALPAARTFSFAAPRRSADDALPAPRCLQKWIELRLWLPTSQATPPPSSSPSPRPGNSPFSLYFITFITFLCGKSCHPDVNVCYFLTQDAPLALIWTLRLIQLLCPLQLWWPVIYRKDKSHIFTRGS